MMYGVALDFGPNVNVHVNVMLCMYRVVDCCEYVLLLIIMVNGR